MAMAQHKPSAESERREEPARFARARLPRSSRINQIIFLLWIVALAIIITFCYFASSICIALLLSSFFAIVLDPVIVHFERWRIPRIVSSAVLIVGLTTMIGVLTYTSYQQVSQVVDRLPEYAQHLGEMIAPITRKVEKVQNSAGWLNIDGHNKKVPVVKVQGEYPTWTSYVVWGGRSGQRRGPHCRCRSVLDLFLLIQKPRLKQKLAIIWGDQIDVSEFADTVTGMVRGFVFGNLIIGLLMAVVTVIVLVSLKVQGAVILGVVSAALTWFPSSVRCLAR